MRGSDELHEGDIVKLNKKDYKITVIVDEKTGIRKIDDIIEIHVLPKSVDDNKFIKIIFDRYKKQLN